MRNETVKMLVNRVNKMLNDKYEVAIMMILGNKKSSLYTVSYLHSCETSETEMFLYGNNNLILRVDLSVDIEYDEYDDSYIFYEDGFDLILSFMD